MQTVSVAASTTVHRIALSSTGGGVILEVPQGIQLGISNQLVVGPNAVLTGGGTILGNVQVAGGLVYPGSTPHVLTVTGNLVSQSNSAIRIDLAGSTAAQADQLNVTSALTLAGNLDVVDTGGYTPSVGDSFQVLKFGSVSGQFDSLTLPALSPA